MNRVDTAAATLLERICPNPNFNAYGLAVDAAGSVWYADYGNGLQRYEPATQTWTSFVEPSGVLRTTTGVVAGTDGAIWVAGHDSSHVAKLDPATGAWTLFNTRTVPAGMAVCTNPRGVTFDAEGHLWAICRGSSSLFEMTTDGTVLGSYAIRDSSDPTRGTGPYSYSDNTGFQLFNYTATEGVWSHRFDAGQSVTFARLTWFSHLPAGTSIEVRVRAALTEADLDAAVFGPWLAGPDVDLHGLAASPARFLDMEFVLRTADGSRRPVLRDLRVFFETADCRDPASPCPDGQLCEPVLGGCSVVPTQCAADGACPADAYCDATSICRPGCRTTPDSCPEGERCDPESRLCEVRVAECLADAACPAGTWCTPGELCEPGCRTDPDSCPARWRCDAITRDCVPLPPECALDTDCEPGAYCDGDGRCTGGCRTMPDDCGAGFVCDARVHECRSAPPACDPALAGPELCNGRDDDCDGEIDEEDPDLGLTCGVGTAASGSRVCFDGRLLCRAQPSLDPAAPLLLAGTVSDVLLPAGHYEVTANATLDQWLRTEPGASVVSTGGDWRLTMAATADVELTGAELSGLHLRMLAGGRLRLDGATFAGRAGGDTLLEASRCSSFRVLRSTLRDVELSTSVNCAATIELSRLEATDRVSRWLGILQGPATVTDTELVGANIVPRVTNGLLVRWGGVLTASDLTVSRMVIGTQVSTTAVHTVERSVFEDSDVGLDVQGGAWIVALDDTFDGLDVGHSMLAMRFTALASGGGGEVRRTTLRLDDGDRAYQLEPDQFQAATPSVLEGSVFTDAGPEGRYYLAGEADTGSVGIRHVDLASSYVLAGDLSFQNGAVGLIEPGTILGTDAPGWRVIRSRWGGRLDVDQATIHDSRLYFEAGTTGTVTGTTVIATVSNPWRYLADVWGTATFTGSTCAYRPATADTPRNGAVETLDAGRTTITGCTFENLEWAVVNRNTSTLSLTGSTFAGSKNAVFGEHRAVLDPVDANLYVNSDPAVAGVGYHLLFDPGGRASVTNAVFDMGAEDTAFVFDPDAFQLASPSTISGSTYVNGQTGKGTTVRGDVRSGEVRFAGVDGQPLDLFDDLYVSAGARATIGPGVISGGPWPGLDYALVVRDAGSALVTEPGAVLEDIRVYVYGGTTGTFTDTTFRATSSENNDLVRVEGTATFDGCTFEDPFAVRQGVRAAGAAGSATVTASTFTGLEWGVYVEDDGVASVDASTFTDVVHPLRVGERGDLVSTGSTITSTTASPAIIGVEAAVPQAGLLLQATGTIFDLGVEDAPFRFATDAFRSDATLSISGSTFGANGIGVGYQLTGAFAAPAGTLAHVEAAQPSFRLIGDIPVRTSASLSVSPGTVLESSGARRRIYAEGLGTLAPTGVTFENVLLSFYGTSTGTVSACTFRSPETWFTDLVYVESSGVVSIDGSSFGRSAANATRLRGVHVGGAATVSPSITNNTFDELETGIYVELNPTPTWAGNVFNACTRDVYEVP